MIKSASLKGIFTALCLLIFSLAKANDPQQIETTITSLNYISPIELIESLSPNRDSSGLYTLSIDSSLITLRPNSNTSQILLRGEKKGIEEIKELIEYFDVPAKQIIVEAKIIEIDNDKSRATGFDWQHALDRTSISTSYRTQSLFEKRSQNHYGDDPYEVRQKSNSDNTSFSAENRLTVGDFLKIVQESEVGKVTRVPKIVTINNKKGTILDGSRVTYVSRYSASSELYQTQEMTSGLMLAVTPSLGQSGFLKMEVTAKLTTLGSAIANSPSEHGQILENTVIAKNGESILLGGFKKTITKTIKKKVPVLGTILPFFFSRDVKVDIEKDILIILTPKVIETVAETIPEQFRTIQKIDK